MKNLHTSLVLLITTMSLSTLSFAIVHTDGYFKKDGTYVQPYYRTSPDRNVYNNWSTKGNINPYTGEEGRKNSDAYSSGYHEPRSRDSY